MHVVLVSSPGTTAAPHWSHAAAAALAAALAARGTRTTWLAASRAGQPLAASPASYGGDVVVMPRPPALARVARDSTQLGLEQRLTHVLRDGAPAIVVHFGLGARGSPNVCWLADRLGAVAFAVVHAAEVVCHRGDLVERGGAPCREFLTAERCRACCRGRWWAPAADAFRSRSDLLAASLFACRTVFVPAAAEVATLTAFGVAERAVVVGTGVADLLARLQP